jgi:hypothetical protein
MWLIKRQDGAYIPHDDFDYQDSQKIKAGTVIESKRAHRNYKFHKKAFALLNTGFKNQEKYATFEIYRKVMTILAGFYDEVVSKRGIEYLPHSISYESMGVDKFDSYYEAMTKVVADDMGVTVQELEDNLI